MIEWAFWLSLAGLFYIFFGYPLLVSGLARLRPLRREKRPVDARVSIVIACHNDAERVEHKLRSLLNSPQEQFIDEILIGSDGSTDNIAERLNNISDSRVQLIEFASRRGKPATLNDLVPQCRNEFVVLCDARQILSDNAIPALLSNFTDPEVGVVSGELKFRQSNDPSTAGQGIGAYWRYEKFIRRAEAGFRSVPGVTGALYAIRRDLFRAIPEATLLDDVVIPMQAITRGCRCVFESEAVAWDDPSTTIGKESIRKRRTIAGAAQLAVLHPAWLLPWKNPIWFEFVSHKMLRLLSPVLLAIAAITNVLLISSPLYYGLLVLHVVFYASAVSGWLFQRHGKSSRLFGIPLMFVTLNLTTIAALSDALRGRFHVAWQRA